MSRQFLITLGAIAAIFLLAILVVPVMDINKTQRANEATAVARLLRINALERDYARSNAEGFACSLEKLKPAGPENDPYDKDEFLLTGENIGYRLVLF